MRPIKTLQSLLARAGVLVFRKRLLPFGIVPAYDVERLFGAPATILDVGANMGQTALEYARAFPGANIYAFEPVPATYEQLRTNVAHLPRVRAIPFGLGAREETVAIELGQADERNSVLNRAGAGATNTAMVRITTGDRWMAGEGLTSIDLLKIDTEGFDVQVLRGFEGTLAAGRVRAVMVECEFDRVTPEPHSNFRDIDQLLAPLGFRVVTFYTHCATPKGMAWGNVLFVHAAARSPATGSVQAETAGAC
ncbi:MAG TPA: FkbM family methyltransferase [Phycisphaerales bacterium]|nr:FkbM family methyltransferase [Phycisphaerales bacterium]